MKLSGYDYIVVGAGSAGCVLAARLSEDPTVKVLLLEAGAPSSSILVHMPAGIRILYKSPKHNWKFWTEPQTELNNRKIYIPRGKVIGGSSSINSMIAIRGNPADYDAWAAQGLPEWGHESLHPYFKKIEDASAVAPQHNQDRGYSGPIRLSYGTLQHPISQAFIESVKSAGWPENKGFNGPSQIGGGFYELTIADGKRSGSFKYLDHAKERSNLTIIANCRVRRLALAGKRVRGVVIERNGREITLSAEREVLLTSGAIGSPHLLMLSGIGPADHLRSFGIKPVIDSFGVGSNLQDHLDCAIRLEASQPITLTPYLGLIKGGLAGARYILNGTGPATSQGIEAGAFWGPNKSSSWPEWQAHLIVALRNPPPKERIEHGFAIRVCQLRPKSRGVLRLRSSDPSDTPSIDPQFLSDNSDFLSMQEGVRQMCEIIDQEPLRKHVKRKIDLDAFTSTETRKSWIRMHAETVYHPVGTCRMGQDNGAVVDSQLRVRGIENLRVVDGSVMPTVISGNTNLPIMAMAEKAADIIVGERSSISKNYFETMSVHSGK
jgi:choline dehydrogenase